MLSRYLNKFPDEYSPTDEQIKLIKKIEKGFNDGYKFVICNAPTGSGKSFIAKTIANVSNEPTQDFVDLISSYEAYKQDYIGNYTYEAECLNEPPFGAFALTVTKQLQDQYLKFFNDGSALKGKSNYKCNVDENFDVETAPCIFTPKLKDECWAKNKCIYYNKRNETLINRFGVLNYKMFLSLPNHVKKKDFLICDEGALLEDEIVKQFSLYVDTTRLSKMGVKVNYLYSEKQHGVYSWLNKISLQISEQVDFLTAKNNKKHATLSQPDRIKLLYLRRLYSDINRVLETWNDCEYIVQRENKNVKLTPYKIDNLSNNIFDYGEKILIMSATIINHKKFAQTLGIKDYKYVEIDSTFDSSKGPIYISNKLKLNYSNLDKNLPKVVNSIKEICNEHKNEKGIIHTHTSKITNYLKQNLGNKRFLYRDEENSNEIILAQHSQDENNSVIVSPSLDVGVDLKDNLARFQIIVKAPFLPLSDNRIKKLFKNDKEWYTVKMLTGIMQQAGRGIRSRDDYCTTYILDGAVFENIIQYKNCIPNYFLDRIN